MCSFGGQRAAWPLAAVWFCRAQLLSLVWSQRSDGRARPGAGTREGVRDGLGHSLWNWLAVLDSENAANATRWVCHCTIIDRGPGFCKVAQEHAYQEVSRNNGKLGDAARPVSLLVIPSVYEDEVLQ